MKTLWESRQYTQIITLAQYLTSLTAQQDVWIEAGKSLINFFNVDVCAFGVRRADGTIIVRHWISAESCFTNVLSPDVTLSGLINPLLGDTELDIHELIEETLAACRREWGLGRHRAIFQKSRFGFVMRYSRFSPTNC